VRSAWWNVSKWSSCPKLYLGVSGDARLLSVRMLSERMRSIRLEFWRSGAPESWEGLWG
jgi:hypothetical protein